MTRNIGKVSGRVPNAQLPCDLPGEGHPTGRLVHVFNDQTAAWGFCGGFTVQA